MERQLRLRFHVMTFLHFLACRSLFPDRKKQSAQLLGDPRWSTSETPPVSKAMLDEWIVLLLPHHPKYHNKAQIAKVVSLNEEGKSRCYSKLTIHQRWKAVRKLRKRVPQNIVDELPLPAQSTVIGASVPNTDGKRNRSETTIMTLYLHNMSIHMPALFEIFDFKTMMTERAEGFLEKLNRILLRFTNRDLETDQPLREVIIRHHYQETILEEANLETETNSKISEYFAENEFTELSVLLDDNNREDVTEFLSHLKQYGYDEKTDWVVQGDLIQFNTLEGTLQVFEKYRHPSW